MSELDVYLAEYKCLKDEQRDRIGARDRLPYVMLTVVAAISYFSFGGPMPFAALAAPVRYSALFLLPPACFVLGWIYLIYDWKVSELGEYFRGKLAPAMSKCTGAGDLLDWEVDHRNVVHRRYRKAMQAVVDVLVFSVSGYASIGAYWVIVDPGSVGRLVFMLLISAMEVAGLCLLSWEIVRHADIAG